MRLPRTLHPCGFDAVAAHLSSTPERLGRPTYSGRVFYYTRQVLVEREIINVYDVFEI